MFQRIKRNFKKTQNKALLMLFSVLSSPAFADLPTVEDPSRDQGSGIFETMKNYAYDAGIFVGLLIATLGFLGVAWHGIAVFSEVQNGKKKWSDFGAVVAVGVILVVVVIWLLSKAADIL